MQSLSKKKQNKISRFLWQVSFFGPQIKFVISLAGKKKTQNGEMVSAKKN